nr:zinc finger protein 675-like [Leptinotarsa decemlineata]
MDWESDDIKLLCRLCLSKAVVSHSLLKEDRANILECLTSIKVTEDDSLPQIACTKCWLNLKYAYRIQQNFLEADEKLRQINFEKEVTENFNMTVKKEEYSDIELVDNDLTEENNINNSSLQTESIEFENRTDEQVLVIYKVDRNVSNEDKTILDEKIVCKICGDEVLGRNVLDHTSSHYFSRIECDQCNICLESIDSYREHCSKHHSDISEKSWKCEVCNTSFIYKPLYLIHQSRAHRKRTILVMKKPSQDTEKIYDCPYCHRKFLTESRSLTHIKSHQKKKCDICNVYITPSNFSNHYKAHSEGPVVCHLCGITYKNSVSLRSHIHYTHSKRTFICQFCQKTYKKSYDLLLHIRREHLGEKNHVCDVCGKRFYTLYTLNKHKRMTHQKLRPYPCQYCKKKFSSKHARVTHERQHTNVTPYKCAECGMGFRQNVSLKSHRISVHNYVEKLTCKCEVCGRKFGSNFAVLSHMRLH